MEPNPNICDGIFRISNALLPFQVAGRRRRSCRGSRRRRKRPPSLCRRCCRTLLPKAWRQRSTRAATALATQRTPPQCSRRAAPRSSAAASRCPGHPPVLTSRRLGFLVGWRAPGASQCPPGCLKTRRVAPAPSWRWRASLAAGYCNAPPNGQTAGRPSWLREPDSCFPF